MKLVSTFRTFVNVGTGLGMNIVGVGIGVGVGGMSVGVGGAVVGVGRIGLGLRLGIGVGVNHTVVTEGIAVIARSPGTGVSVGSRSGAITLVSVEHRQQLNKPSTKIAAAMSAFPKQD